MHLLVADDNEINLRVACAYLKALGIPPESIHTASNGREATELCNERDFDLIFMDIQMPEVDGIEATRQILENKETKPAIVALTANTSEEAEREYRAAGMKMVLHKPVNKSAFMSALKLAEAS
ncbi:MAG: response regulator [Kangiellaceae bacterium]|nr:response regulator [Kangiellaceae bacterium]MCW9015331.1 response regulator [Kangiellaceae bacterium]